MATYSMTFDGIVYDDVANTITMNLRTAAPSAPPPNGVPLTNWYPQAGQVVQLVAPARKLPDITLTGVAIVADPSAPDKTAHWRYTWNGTSWASPVRVNNDGSLYP